MLFGNGIVFSFLLQVSLFLHFKRIIPALQRLRRAGVALFAQHKSDGRLKMGLLQHEVRRLNSPRAGHKVPRCMQAPWQGGCK